jgi:hypothetical protein
MQAAAQCLRKGLLGNRAFVLEVGWFMTRPRLCSSNLYPLHPNETILGPGTFVRLAWSMHASKTPDAILYLPPSWARRCQYGIRIRVRRRDPVQLFINAPSMPSSFSTIFLNAIQCHLLVIQAHGRLACPHTEHSQSVIRLCLTGNRNRWKPGAPQLARGSLVVLVPFPSPSRDCNAVEIPFSSLPWMS